MNANELIESGQVELYVAGAISSDEKRLIEELASEYPAITSEIKEVEDEWNSFALAYARNPRPQIRKKIIDHVIKEGGKIKSLSIESDVTRGDDSDIKWWLTAAAIGLLIMVSGLNYMFYMKWTEAEDELARLRNTLTIENNEAPKSSFINNY
jgi:hypothetical protein